MEKAKQIAEQIKKEVNKQHRTLYIDTDSEFLFSTLDPDPPPFALSISVLPSCYLLLDMFKCLLLLRKKKYAAVSCKEVDGKVVTSIEKKGLDLVRRDWCDLSRNVGAYGSSSFLI